MCTCDETKEKERKKKGRSNVCIGFIARGVNIFVHTVYIIHVIIYVTIIHAFHFTIYHQPSPSSFKINVIDRKKRNFHQSKNWNYPLIEVCDF